MYRYALLMVLLSMDSSFPAPTPLILWQPFNTNQTRDDFFSKFGFPDDQFDFVLVNVPALKRKMAELAGRQIKDEEQLSPTFDDLILSPEQIKFMLDFYTELLENKTNPDRRKRKIFNLKTFPVKKWTMPIPYKIDNGFDEIGLKLLKEAIQSWEENTCIQFKELDLKEKFVEPHLLFEAKFDQCLSHVGKNPDVIPQSVLLGKRVCPKLLGTFVHEIGHAIGLFHEQNRYDSTKFVEVIEDELEYGAEGQVMPFEASWMKLYGVPYDLGSVMQYHQFSFSKALRPKRPTIKALEKMFQNTMGQRTGLSFYDVKIANLEYCPNICPHLACERGGIPNPAQNGKKCKECICPDGFSGPTCNTVAPSDPECDPNSQNIIDVTSTTEQCVKSPNYGNDGYKPYSKCNWILKSKPGSQISMRFKGDFNVYCFAKTITCFHWVEIKFKNISNPGPRFCCSRTPTVELLSEDNEAVVTFRSNHDDQKVQESDLKGFQLCYKLVENTKETTVEQVKTTSPEMTTLTPEIVTTKKVGTCPKGFKFSQSATGCPATCADPKAPKNCKLPKISGCVCKGKMVLDKGKCVKRNKCESQCKDGNGKQYKVGEMWLSFDCKKSFTCKKGQKVKQFKHQCSGSEECRVKDGIGTCKLIPIVCPTGKINEIFTPLNFQNQEGFIYTVNSTKTGSNNLHILKGAPKIASLQSEYRIEITSNNTQPFRLMTLEYKVTSANQTVISFEIKGSKNVVKTITLIPKKTTSIFLGQDNGLPSAGLNKITKIEITFTAAARNIRVTDLALQTCMPQRFIFVHHPTL